MVVPFTVKLPGTVKSLSLNVDPSTKTLPLSELIVKFPDAPVCCIFAPSVLSIVIWPAIFAPPLTSNVVVSVSPATVSLFVANVNKSVSESLPIVAPSSTLKLPFIAK